MIPVPVRFLPLESNETVIRNPAASQELRAVCFGQKPITAITPFPSELSSTLKGKTKTALTRSTLMEKVTGDHM